VWIAISFDYDSPAGYRQSFRAQKTPPDADLAGTEAILKVLRTYNVRATFAVVGAAALDGEPPEHCQDQIRQMDAEGHEVASHSMFHRFIPPMTNSDLLEDLEASRLALERCIASPIRGFVPPFNRPMHFPRKGAPSISEIVGAHGRGRGRQSIASMLTQCRRAGYQWARVSYANKALYLAQRLGVLRDCRPSQPFLMSDIVALPLHITGFGEAARRSVRRWGNDDVHLTLYAHPSRALFDEDQGVVALAGLLGEMNAGPLRKHVRFCTMGQMAQRVLEER
jgi:peptidoglycan/xylan/chitin deacetylase (PgdA/CDA1 family)